MVSIQIRDTLMMTRNIVQIIDYVPTAAIHKTPSKPVPAIR